eukprot:NODE_1475_length_1152_cov_94.791478_g1207_i0.p2 GENE.NODE_1475_length_1152_cov_94.791478_g1207_i0~~NODE_1475_length_1152_cov_94.791478_g1207_i0.p2  ORF type:complete len:186 (-),score=28.74 NODE_1475_length_1152_cov_94.791478_g1207_i0:42-599(-)
MCRGWGCGRYKLRSIDTIPSPRARPLLGAAALLAPSTVLVAAEPPPEPPPGVQTLLEFLGDGHFIEAPAAGLLTSYMGVRRAHGPMSADEFIALFSVKRFLPPTSDIVLAGLQLLWAWADPDGRGYLEGAQLQTFCARLGISNSLGSEGMSFQAFRRTLTGIPPAAQSKLFLAASVLAQMSKSKH